MSKTILVCGEALFDFFLSASDGPGQIDFDARSGGSPFNVALGLARLGSSASLFTGLSTDFLGVRLAEQLANEGVDTSLALRLDRPTTLSLVGLDASGSPAYGFYGEGAADRMITEADLPNLNEKIGTLHFGSFSTVVPPAGDASLALAGREEGRCISYDPNIRPTIEPDLDVWRRRVAELAACSDILKISDEDFEALWPSADPSAQAQEWLGGRTSLVVLTRGSQPARAWTADGECLSPASNPISVIDTVGAGDTFQAALLHQLNERGALSPGAPGQIGEDALKEVLGFATSAAAVTCSRRGADLPSSAEVIEFMSGANT